jgi:hypothetical protein
MPRQVSSPLTSKISPAPANYITCFLSASIGICEYLCWLTLKLALMSWQSSSCGPVVRDRLFFPLIPSKLMIMDLSSSRDI